MADPVQDVLAVRSYQGDPSAGGGVYGGIKIDPTPFDKLEQFTYFENKDKWERQNKLDDANAVEIGKIASLDPASTNPDVYNYFEKRKQDLLDKVKRGGLNYQKNPDLYIETVKGYSDFVNQRTVAVANQTKELQWSNLIDAAQTGEEKNSLIAQRDFQLKELYKDGLESAFTSKPPIQSYNPVGEKPIQMPDLANSFVVKTAVIGSNNNVEIKRKFNDVNQAWSDADKLILGFQNDVFTPSTAAQKNPDLLKNEQTRFDERNRQLLVLNKSVDKYNAFIEPFKGDLLSAGTDEQKFNAVMDKMSTEGGPGSQIFVDMLRNNFKYNQKAAIANQELKNAANQGYKPNVAPYQYLNISDGLSPKEYLVGSAVYGKDLMADYEEDITHTGDANELAKTNITQAGENYRANLPYEKTKATQKDQQAAVEQFGNLIYGVNDATGTTLNGTKAFIKNGTFVDKDGNVLSDINGDFNVSAKAFNNSIVLEYNKYAAGKTVTKDENGIATTTNTNGGSAVLKPVNGKLKVKYENGVIKGIYAEDGTLIDDNMFQHITLEAGQKSVTKYKKPDTKYGTPAGPGSSSDAAINLTGNEDPSSLKAGQIYVLDGKKVLWNGKNLIKQ